MKLGKSLKTVSLTSVKKYIH